METLNNSFNDKTEVSRNNKMLMTAVIIIILAIAALAIAGFLFIKPKPDTIQGQGDATEIRISGKLPGRVMDIYVEEGQRVKAGDTLVRIHSSVADAKLYQAKAMETAASATDRKVDAGSRTQIIAGARNLYNQAVAASGIAKKTYDRMQNLFAQGVVSEQKRDEAKAAYDAAKAGEAAALSQYELARTGAQKEDKEAAKAMVNVARGGVKEIDALLEDQYLLAPCDGTITVIYPNESELIAMGAPIMNLQKDDYWAVFNVRENYLKNISEGSRIKVYIPALDVKTEMTVFYIRDLGTYANWQATKSTGDYDARTFQIKARPEQPVKNFRPGMSVILEQ